MTDIFDKFAIVLTSCPNATEAQELSRLLVTEKLAACVSIIPQVTSIYYWGNAVQTESEVMLLIKTSADQIKSLESVLHLKHSYQVPEFIVLTPESLSSKYGKWILEVCQSPK